MSTTRKFSIRALEVPIEDAHGNVVGHVTDIALEVGADPATGLVTFKPAKVWMTKDVSDQLALQAGSRTDYDRAAEVWKVYVEVMNPRNKGLGPEERRLINEALKVATVSECQNAIRGCRASTFHMGENDRRRKYNRLSQILKGRGAQGQGRARTTRETIDYFLDIYAKSGGESHVPSVDNAKLREAKQDVRDALEFPGDVHLADRGGEARRWLEEHGFKVAIDGTTVTFVPPPDP